MRARAIVGAYDKSWDGRRDDVTAGGLREKGFSGERACVGRACVCGESMHGEWLRRTRSSSRTAVCERALDYATNSQILYTLFRGDRCNGPSQVWPKTSFGGQRNRGAERERRRTPARARGAAAAREPRRGAGPLGRRCAVREVLRRGVAPRSDLSAHGALRLQSEPSFPCLAEMGG